MRDSQHLFDTLSCRLGLRIYMTSSSDVSRCRRFRCTNDGNVICENEWKIGGGSLIAVPIIVAAALPKVTTPPSQFMTSLQYKLDGYQILSAQRRMQTQ